MKRTAICIAITSLLMSSCSNDDTTLQDQYEFITPYTTTVTVGGVVGTTERIFEIGEVYEGKQVLTDSIKIRIAVHTERNNDCPNSWCYQELLNVPQSFLRLQE